MCPLNLKDPDWGAHIEIRELIYYSDTNEVLDVTDEKKDIFQFRFLQIWKLCCNSSRKDLQDRPKKMELHEGAQANVNIVGKSYSQKGHSRSPKIVISLLAFSTSSTENMKNWWKIRFCNIFVPRVFNLVDKFLILIAFLDHGYILTYKINRICWSTLLTAAWP